ncbi:hypothetical protein, partial [Streptomyces sp. PRh5]|uniref:hypothetical protein n=1 Tax=Streptomyces sp. PRh5 TaxID=1158056 RepID=UPI00321FAB3F
MTQNNRRSRPNDLHDVMLTLSGTERGQPRRQTTGSHGNGRSRACGDLTSGQTPQQRRHRAPAAGQPAQVQSGRDRQRRTQGGGGLEQREALLRRQRLNATATQARQTRTLQVAGHLRG